MWEEGRAHLETHEFLGSRIQKPLDQNQSNLMRERWRAEFCLLSGKRENPFELTRKNGVSELLLRRCTCLPLASALPSMIDHYTTIDRPCAKFTIVRQLTA